jgi:hypothetical protein
MAIDINKSTTRVDPPNVVLLGQRVRGDNGKYGGIEDTDTITTLEETIESSTSVRKREVLVYRGNVTVSLVPDSTHNANSYSNRDQVNDFIGVQDLGIAGTSRSETYYTLNGKDPKRTKSNLYAGKFIIRRNETGADNTIIKARTYVEGLSSSVMKVEIRIIRASDAIV